MDRTLELIGHLDWMLSKSSDLVCPDALGIYNCAIRLRLRTLDGSSWSPSISDRVRQSLRTLVDQLATSALRLYLNERDAKEKDPRLATSLMAKGQAVVAFVRALGFSVVTKEQQWAYPPAPLSEVVAALSRYRSETGADSSVPGIYTDQICGGLLDLLSSAAHSISPEKEAEKVGRTMLNTGAATIRQAGQDEAAAVVPSAVKQHNTLAARALHKQS